VSALEVVQNLMEAISQKKKEGYIFRGSYNTTLDLFADQPESSEPLPESGIHALSMSTSPTSRTYILGIDGSSRRFMTPYGGFALATVAVTLAHVPVLDYPPLHYEYPLDLHSREPQAYIATYEGLRAESPYVTTTSPGGNPFLEDTSSSGQKGGYALADMAHEIRTELETFGLHLSIELAEALSRSLGSSPGRNFLLLLDGPLYQRPWKAEVLRTTLAEDWKVLTERRVKVLERARERGVPVVGSVKRLEKSTFLVRIHGTLMGYLGEPFSKQGNDFAEVCALLRSYIRKRNLTGYDAFLVGPFLIRARNLGVPEEVNAPDIVYSYLAVPVLPYTGGSEDVSFNVLRLELSKDQYDKFGFDIFKEVLNEGFLTSLGLPVPQASADRRCKDTSRAIVESAAEIAFRMGVEISYETRMEILGNLGEL